MAEAADRGGHSFAGARHNTRPNEHEQDRGEYYLAVHVGGHVDQGRAVVLEVVEQGRVVLLGDVLLLHQARHGESHFLYTKHVDISMNMIMLLKSIGQAGSQDDHVSSVQICIIGKVFLGVLDVGSTVDLLSTVSPRPCCLRPEPSLIITVLVLSWERLEVAHRSTSIHSLNSNHSQTEHRAQVRYHRVKRKFLFIHGLLNN